MPILTVEKLTKSFGGLTAVSNVNMEINEGELLGLIGPNGAGKTTLFNLLTGVYVPTTGKIVFRTKKGEESIQGLRPYKICGKGIARTFQNIRLFKNLTVLDNVRIAMHKDIQYGIFSSFVHGLRYNKEEKKIVEESIKLLEILGLDKKKEELANNLPYGEQRHLEIARALATNPSLLLLDEPAAGMNPAETTELISLIRHIREEFNLTILLIEHDMSLVMQTCERIYVLDYGKIIANGTPEQIKSDKRVIEAYLGEDVNNA
ncbi:MAG: ABC transporter ATP-binding protein [Eubacteriales bacterium]|jgi:branched-chain amino acid transport system ATP-binding protein|nr:ABC transporter ATP-binding protein [Eubacteriales bacterium]